MWKTVLAGTTAFAIAGSAIAYAQTGAGKGERTQGWRPSAADIAAFADARIAGLKAGLELTTEQQKHWPAVETAMRDLAKQRAERIAAWRDAKKPTDPVARLSRRAEAMESRGAALKKLADAAGPLYASLNDAQKQRFVVLARLGGRSFGHGHRGWRGRHEGRGWGHHRGHYGWRSGGPQGGPGAQ